MEYISLYRRYRPDTFDGVYGQEHIKRILINQIKSGKVSHAYLFTGTRGTGKTSTAKIFARAVNCTHNADGSPCGKCAVCKTLENGNNLDILEIDAASNNGVEEIRDLKEKIKYPPVSCKYKVYIIDEVHMLSPSAFNALLKTLEEPPAHAIFILATTEAQKIPQTVASRCLRFDFRLVSAGLLESQLKNIYNELGKEYEDAAISAIAAAGVGSVRDTLSLADMCLSYSSGRLTYKDVLEVLGTSDKKSLLKLAENILDGNIRAVLISINESIKRGCSITAYAKDIAGFFRDLLLVKNSDGVLELPSELIAEMKALTENRTNAGLLRVLEILSSIEGDMRLSSQPRIILEAACVRAADLNTDLENKALGERLNQLERKFSEANSGAPVKATEPPQEINLSDAKMIWGTVLGILRSRNMYAIMNSAKNMQVEMGGDGKIVARIVSLADQRIIDAPNNRFELAKIVKSISGTLELEIINMKTDSGSDLERITKLARADAIKINK